MIDTHTHLYLEQFEDGGESAVREALASGINHLIFPNVDESTVEPLHQLHNKFPDHTSMAMGLHPTEVNEDWEDILIKIELRLKRGIYIAVGEIGLDLYWDKSKIQLQYKAFENQLRLADKYRLPAIIHCREATAETIAIIKKTNPQIPLIFHSFTGNSEDVRLIRTVCNPYFGINGVVTYKNAPGLRSALPEIGADRIVLETDSPYLAPVPKRGKLNKSIYLNYIRDKVAECLNLPVEEIESITDSNAIAIFNL